MSINCWINKVIYPQTRLLFGIKNEVLIHATTGIIFINITLKERIQSHTIYVRSYLYESPKVSKFVETEIILMVA